MPKFGERLQHAWNAFFNKDPTYRYDYGVGYGYRPDRAVLSRGSERTIITSIYNRIALDVAAIDIRQVQLDGDERIESYVKSYLNNCLTLEANKDQTARAFIQDIVISMFDEGSVAVVPTDATGDPILSNTFDVKSMRVGKITQWYPDYVMVNLYNEKTGLHEDLTLPKKMIAIIENPLYIVMNQPNSILQRIVRKLNLLDIVDEQSSSGKLDLIIQLPYVIRSPQRRDQAEQRRRQIEEQLKGSKYGIAYTDGTERITQLNRAVENNLLAQIEYLLPMLYSQLGLSEAIFNGTANELEMLNYYNRTLEPIVSAIRDEFLRKFLTPNIRTRGQTILFFRDPFKLLPANQIAEIADVYTRNEIMTANEFRSILGREPSTDPKADMLLNKNNISYDSNGLPTNGQNGTDLESELQDIADTDVQLDELSREVNGGQPEEEEEGASEVEEDGEEPDFSDLDSDLDAFEGDINKSIENLVKELSESGGDVDTSEIEKLLKELDDENNSEDSEVDDSYAEILKMLADLEKEMKGE